MELIRKSTIAALDNSGIVSRQLLCPSNSTSTRVTITEVNVPPGGVSPRHAHATSEQVWVALEGRGELLLADGRTERFDAGDVARFADGDVHGLRNNLNETFRYLSVTSPPIDFGQAYQSDWSENIAADSVRPPSAS